MNTSDSTNANDWSNYWQKGFLTTFVGADEENYSGEIRNYWRETFSTISKSQHIVDLAAGNGALLALACEDLTILSIDVKMTALDLANIEASPFYKRVPEIEVIENTSLTSTPFETSSIDMCISQFGFEYANEEQAVNEVARILKPDGRFNAIIHNTESVVTLHSKSAIEQISLCGRSGLTETTAKLLRRLQKLKKTHRDIQKDQKASEMRDYFNAMAARLKEYGAKLPESQHIDYFLNELSSLFGKDSKEMTLETKLSIIDTLERDSASYYSRMLSMVDASKDPQAMSKLQDLFNKADMEILKVEPITEDGRNHAWIFEAKGKQ
ncbi:MAG: class I SAM-dependent methyltransferase [Acidiferrobacterales bacterium]|nr:class I SAM-dependent methyltransferase [Acidiferrobacterales bacterium]